ncbi:MAG: S-layer homology domain-containing protein, partial [Chloroflexota bacterium]
MKTVRKTLSILFILAFILGGMPAWTVQASQTSIPPGLDAADWDQIQSLLPETPVPSATLRASAVPNSQQAYLKASNTDAYDYFSYSVALSGDTVVIGAYREDSSTTGVNGNQDDDSAEDAGAAYVFVRDGETWSQQAYLKASNTDPTDRFGYSVAISDDTIVIGAPFEDSNTTGVNGPPNNGYPDSGAAYVFVRNGETWSQQAYVKASNTDIWDYFGNSVSISGDTLVVGANGEDSNSTGVNGFQGNNTATDAGAAYVFTRSGETWSQQAYLKASNTEDFDNFGIVSISGDTIVVSAYRESSNATGVNGNQDNNLAADSGAAYVFARDGGIWSQQAYLKASNTGASDYFGWSTSISGDTILVGAYGEDSSATGVDGNQADNSAYNAGAAYVFTREGAVWSQQAYFKASNTGASDYFGYSTSISGDTLMVGAYGEDSSAAGTNGDQGDNSANNAGAVYAFMRNGAAWSQGAYLKASNPDVYDWFGYSVSISSNTAVVGAYCEGSNATGVDGNQGDNSAYNAGAAYVYASDTTPPTVVAITRANPNPTSAASVDFTVTFSESVTGVDVEDFILDKTGTILEETVDSVTGGPTVYAVRAGTGAGSGALRLDIPVTASITDLAGNPFSGLPYTSGETYSVRPQTFNDVPMAYWAWNFIERLYLAGVTGGCSTSPLMYCPEANVTRAQMAVFLLIAEHGTGYTPPPATGLFNDVPADNGFAKWIEQLVAEGITGGCGGGNFCPDAPVTREQMAVFLLIAKYGLG